MMWFLPLMLGCQLNMQVDPSGEDGTRVDLRIGAEAEAQAGDAPTEHELKVRIDLGGDAGNPIVQHMRDQKLIYTQHGSCRMECRNIDEDEVQAILNKDGVLQPERSRTDGDCPTHALEGETGDGQEVRVVYAACEDVTKVVTVIDLNTDWPCGDC